MLRTSCSMRRPASMSSASARARARDHWAIGAMTSSWWTRAHRTSRVAQASSWARARVACEIQILRRRAAMNASGWRRAPTRTSACRNAAADRVWKAPSASASAAAARPTALSNCPARSLEMVASSSSIAGTTSRAQVAFAAAITGPGSVELLVQRSIGLRDRSTWKAVHKSRPLSIVPCVSCSTACRTLSSTRSQSTVPAGDARQRPEPRTGPQACCVRRPLGGHSPDAPRREVPSRSARPDAPQTLRAPHEELPGGPQADEGHQPDCNKDHG